MSEKAITAVLRVHSPLAPTEMEALREALLAMPDAIVGPTVLKPALGMTAKEMALTVALSVTANFATDAIRSAVETSGLADKLTIEAILPTPGPGEEPAAAQKAAPPRENE